jgi:chemotaxis receptor (MCP) glutamine deamidase CheD
MQKQRITSLSKEAKTYNSGNLIVLTYLTTCLPVGCFDRAEQTGSLAFSLLVDRKASDFRVKAEVDTWLSEMVANN